MKVLKRLVAIILVLATFAGGFAGSYSFFAVGTYDYDIQDLSVFDEELTKYYLRDVNSQMVFRVICEGDRELDFLLQDIEGNEMNPTVQKVGNGIYDILPPENGYIKGAQYALSLGTDVYFFDENLSEARTLVFIIEKDPVEMYEFTDAVVEVDSTIRINGENTIDTSEFQVSVGDVVFGKDEKGDYVAYKIVNINGNTAEIEIPSIDEIYSELEVYGEYTWDVDEIVANPEINATIVENVKRSEWYQVLLETAYADEIPADVLNVKIEPNSDENSLEIEIKITLKAGAKGLFGDIGFQHQEVSITLKTKLGIKTNCNIQGVKKWDISAIIASDFAMNVDIRFLGKDELEDTDLKDLFAEDNKFANRIEYHKKVRAITEKLNELAADASAGEIKLFDWNIPIPSIPGLYFSAEIKLLGEMEFAAEVTVGQSVSTVYMVGVCFVDNEFQSYSNQYLNPGKLTLSLKGKAEAKLGLVLEIGATLIHEKIANVNIDPKIGVYEEIYVTFPISDIEEINEENFLYSYFEPGIFFSADLSATLNIGIKDLECKLEIIEKKYNIKELTIGNKKIALGLSVNANTVRAIDKVVTVPDVLFEYYDVTKGTTVVEKLSLEAVKFTTNEGVTLKVRNGKITLPDATNSSFCYITATYLHTDGKTYSTIFRVLISGSVVEGKVSSYNSDLSTTDLENAEVKIYSALNRLTPIGTIKTDENGKFCFNVSAGEYVLVISAEGYRTLTSNQSVGEDEIKYTEHILLMDGAQVGNGTAGGTITNALDGRGIAGVTVKLRTEWNNTTGEYVDYETMTDSAGRYSLENIPVGYYTVEASMNGYVTGYTNVIVLSDAQRTDFDFTITPILNEEEIRIILTWGQYPYDLDSHLIGRTPSNDTFNVYYSNKYYYYEGYEMANLDVDDTTSYGPETITILDAIYGTYTYAVHDYSNQNSSSSEKLSESNAIVRVFVGSEQVGEYHVPTDQVGTYWTVFKITGNCEIIPVNSISNTKPEP